MTNEDEAERRRRELIERRAYAIYQARGGEHGFHEEDWLRAEQEVDGLQPDYDRLPDSDDEERREEQE